MRRARQLGLSPHWNIRSEGDVRKWGAQFLDIVRAWGSVLFRIYPINQAWCIIRYKIRIQMRRLKFATLRGEYCSHFIE